MRNYSARTLFQIATGLLVLCTLALHGVASLDSSSSRTLNAAELKTGTFRFADIDVHYQMYSTNMTKEDSPVVLFLHGMQFTSDTWASLGTLKLIGELGFKAMAVDLPGFGKTRRLPYSDNNMRAEFVSSAFEFVTSGHNLTKVGGILVTPSMSGKYAIPYLDRYGRALKGWLALAPVGVKQWGGPWEDTHKAVRMLAMYGENDPLKPDADILMKLFQKSSKAVITGGEHAFYMTQTEQFHNELKRFTAECFNKKRLEL